MSKLSRHELAAILAGKQLAGLSGKRLSEEVAAYLLTEQRVSELDSLMRDIMQLRSDKGIVEVIAVSAHELTDTVRRNIEAQVRKLYPSAQKIIISERLDPGIIAGVRIEFANQQLDLSVLSKLNRFKQLTAVGE